MGAVTPSSSRYRSTPCGMRPVAMLKARPRSMAPLSPPTSSKSRSGESPSRVPSRSHTSRRYVMRAAAGAGASHRAFAAREAGGAVRAAEVQRLAAAFPPHRAGTRHVGAAERILHELIGPILAAQSRPPAPEKGRDEDEAGQQQGEDQQHAHEIIPDRGVWRGSGGNRDRGPSARSR